MARQIRQVRRTVLAMCEGKGDVAFLLYLRTLYCSGKVCPPKVTIRQAHGKGGDNVVSTLLGLAATTKPDRLVALIDNDLPPAPAKMREAKSKKVDFVFAEPCIEGFILRLLGKHVPAASSDCKIALKQIDPRDLFDEGFFADVCPKDLLETQRNTVQELTELIAWFEG